MTWCKIPLINFFHFMFVDPCIIVQFIKKNPTRYDNVSKFYYSISIWSSTCLGRHTAHHQEPKTALAASGFLYVEGRWTCSWWTLSGTKNQYQEINKSEPLLLQAWWTRLTDIPYCCCPLVNQEAADKGSLVSASYQNVHFKCMHTICHYIKKQEQ
jgi:hypothetical protein